MTVATMRPFAGDTGRCVNASEREVRTVMTPFATLLPRKRVCREEFDSLLLASLARKR